MVKSGVASAAPRVAQHHGGSGINGSDQQQSSVNRMAASSKRQQQRQYRKENGSNENIKEMKEMAWRNRKRRGGVPRNIENNQRKRSKPNNVASSSNI